MRTTRIESRGFERESRTGISLRRELAGAAEALVARFEEELSGRPSSADSASLRSRCRLRCGSSARSGVGGMAVGICGGFSVE